MRFYVIFKLSSKLWESALQSLHSDFSYIPIYRSELTSKEEQWQKCRESLEKRIFELEYSHEKDKKSNASAIQIIKHGDIEEAEFITEKYINVVYIV